jgi:epoxyqueuosine reductase QueG
MGGEPMEDWVMDAMTSILGCELCQSICPYNREIEPVSDVPEVFALEKLLSGDVKPALKIVGTNLNKTVVLFSTPASWRQSWAEKTFSAHRKTIGRSARGRSCRRGIRSQTSAVAISGPISSFDAKSKLLSNTQEIILHVR